MNEDCHEREREREKGGGSCQKGKWNNALDIGFEAHRSIRYVSYVILYVPNIVWDAHSLRFLEVVCY